MACHLVAHMCFDVRPWHRVSRHVDACECVEDAMLQPPHRKALVANDANVLTLLGGLSCFWHVNHLPDSVRNGTRRMLSPLT